MDALRIVWKKQALHRLEDIAQWYEDNMGHTAAHNFVTGIIDTIQTLSHSPEIGTVDTRRSTNQLIFLSFVAHPKYRIVYYYNSRSIYIVTIHRTKMKNG